ncbi:MAG: TorF family putative porin [Pseudomonadota bacterium]|nr:TorF family putative porin [Pseudomonadota bacterium]
MNLKSKTALAALGLIACTATFAQDKAPEPDHTWSFNLGAVSDYRFRGLEQTAGGPSIQGGIDFAHKSGFYAGTFVASNIKWIKEFNGSTKGDWEVDLYGGYKGEAMGLGYDVGLITYQYPGNNSGEAGTPGGAVNYSKADTSEAYVGVSYKMVSLKYSHSMGDFLGNKDTNGSRYWDLSANFDLGNGFTLTPHVGWQTLPTNSTSNTANTANYSDYALTLAKDMGNGVVISLAAIGTDAKRSFYTSTFGNNSRFYGQDTVVLGLKYTF